MYANHLIDPNELVPNDWNTNIVSPVNEKKLEESIKRFGVFKPVIVRELANGSYQIIGGEHRAQAAKRLGIKEIPIVNLGQIDDKKAKEISLVDNGRFGDDDTVRLAELLNELGSPEDLALFMPYTDDDLNTIFTGTSIALDELDSLNLPNEDVNLPSEKAIQTHRVMRFKIPVADAERIANIIEATVKSQGYDDNDSLVNAGDALVHLLREY